MGWGWMQWTFKGAQDREKTKEYGGVCLIGILNTLFSCAPTLALITFLMFLTQTPPQPPPFTTQELGPRVCYICACRLLT